MFTLIASAGSRLWTSSRVDSEELEVAARRALNEVLDPQALILTDVFGATPCNVAQRIADGVDVRVVTGVTFP